MVFERKVVQFVEGRREGKEGPEKPCPDCGTKTRTTYTERNGQWLLRIRTHYDPRALGWTICAGSDSVIAG